MSSYRSHISYVLFTPEQCGFAERTRALQTDRKSNRVYHLLGRLKLTEPQCPHPLNGALGLQGAKLYLMEEGLFARSLAYLSSRTSKT